MGATLDLVSFCAPTARSVWCLHGQSQKPSERGRVGRRRIDDDHDIRAAGAQQTEGDR